MAAFQHWVKRLYEKENHKYLQQSSAFLFGTGFLDPVTYQGRHPSPDSDCHFFAAVL